MDFIGTHLLSLILFTPAAAAVIMLFFPKDENKLFRWFALGASLIPFVLSLVWFNFNASQPGHQFEEIYPWYEALGSSLHLGVDGLSLSMVLLTTFLTRPWTVTALFDASNAASPGVSVSMLGDKDTLVLSSLTPGDPGYSGGTEQKGRSILVTRTAPSTAFVALHEPFRGGVGAHAIEKFESIAKTGAAIAVRIVGKAGSGIDDRILLRFGDNPGEPTDIGDARESYTFADHLYLRIGPDTVNAVGKARKLAIPVKGHPKLIVNGKERPAQIADGILKAELDDKWPPLPARAATTQNADTNSLAGLIAQLHGADIAKREEAAHAIGKMGAAGKEAIPALIECLKQKVRLGNKAAPNGLAGIGPAAVPALIETMRTTPSRVR